MKTKSNPEHVLYGTPGLTAASYLTLSLDYAEIGDFAQAAQYAGSAAKALLAHLEDMCFRQGRRAAELVANEPKKCARKKARKV